MASLFPEKLTSSNNELVKERNRAAAERTMTAWIQNCFALVGIGIAIEEVWLARQALYPEQPVILSKEAVTAIGLGFIAFGIILLLAAIVQHYIEVQSIRRDDYFHMASHPLNIVVVVSIFVFGILGMLAILLS